MRCHAKVKVANIQYVCSAVHMPVSVPIDIGIGSVAVNVAVREMFMKDVGQEHDYHPVMSP